MKTLLLATATTLALASSVSAANIIITLPTLTFPPSDSVTMGKDCLPQTTTTPECALEE